MKKLLIIVLITGALAACSDNNNQDSINNDANRDSTSTMPVSPDTSMMNTDTTGGRQNPNHNQDSLRHN
jgi:uncharacterized lipoprotein